VITHPPIYDIDLTKQLKTALDPEVRTAARSSFWRFAWETIEAATSFSSGTRGDERTDFNAPTRAHAGPD
jgi:hypothetical protein